MGRPPGVRCAAWSTNVDAPRATMSPWTMDTTTDAADDWSPTDNPYAIAVSEARRVRTPAAARARGVDRRDENQEDDAQRPVVREPAAAVTRIR
jgi:hypothetical protein